MYWQEVGCFHGEIVMASVRSGIPLSHHVSYAYCLECHPKRGIIEDRSGLSRITSEFTESAEVHGMIPDLSCSHVVVLREVKLIPHYTVKEPMAVLESYHSHTVHTRVSSSLGNLSSA